MMENSVQKNLDAPTRYYHLCVSNTRRWSPEQDVRVALLGVEEIAASGDLVPVWLGDVPHGVTRVFSRQQERSDQTAVLTFVALWRGLPASAIDYSFIPLWCRTI